MVRSSSIQSCLCAALLHSCAGFCGFFFLEDMLNRYYDRRQVTIDIMANLYKEKRAEVIPTLWPEQTNSWLKATMPSGQADYRKGGSGLL